MKKWGTLLLAIWLVVTGLVALTGLSFAGLGVVLSLLAIAAGVLLLIEGSPRRLTQNLGILLLAAWLILGGVITLLDFSFPAGSTLLALLAIAAGVVLILRR
jgi:hypothetical protein